jgi:hypothetical protein
LHFASGLFFITNLFILAQEKEKVKKKVAQKWDSEKVKICAFFLLTKPRIYDIMEIRPVWEANGPANKKDARRSGFLQH